MPENSNIKRPVHLWIVGIFSLLWNIMGAFDYYMTQSRNEAYMAKFTPEQLEYFYGFPVWVDAAWALAVWGAVVGSILLLLKMKITKWVFLGALVAMVLTSIYNFVLSNGMDFMGDPFSLIFTAIIFVVSVALYLYARALVERGVLR